MNDTIITLPYIARLAVWFLLDQDEMAELVGENIYTDLPAGHTFPAVRITQIGGRVVPGPHWLEATTLQAEAWGPGGNDRLAAHTTVETARSLFASSRFRGEIDHGSVEAVVTGVDAGGIVDDSDDSFKPARPRSRFDLVVYAHPTVTTGS